MTRVWDVRQLPIQTMFSLMELIVREEMAGTMDRASASVEISAAVETLHVDITAQ